MKRQEICDVVIQSRHDVMVLDVPCKVCIDCNEILECYFNRSSGIDAATLTADGSQAGYSLITQQRSQKARNAWTGIFLYHNLTKTSGIFLLGSTRETYGPS